MASHSSSKKTLSDRFNQVIEREKANATEKKMAKMSFEELGRQVIAFGDVKLGQPFQEVIQDTQYVKFFTTKYGNSKKDTHVQFLKYIEMYVEKAEAIQKTTRPKAKAQGNKCVAIETPISSDSEPGTEGQSALWDVVDPESQLVTQQMEAQNHRINQLEVALTQIVGQLQTISAQLTKS